VAGPGPRRPRPDVGFRNLTSGGRPGRTHQTRRADSRAVRCSTTSSGAEHSKVQPQAYPHAMHRPESKPDDPSRSWKRISIPRSLGPFGAVSSVGSEPASSAARDAAGLRAVTEPLMFHGKQPPANCTSETRRLLQRRAPRASAPSPSTATTLRPLASRQSRAPRGRPARRQRHPRAFRSEHQRESLAMTQRQLVTGCVGQPTQSA
jgi:hypothetical protein